jgi:hypothetical protein
MGLLKWYDNRYTFRRRKRYVNYTTVGKLNLETIHPSRGGVILYTILNGELYFALGLDSRTHELTDFAGGISYKRDGNVISGALREYQEETLNIFSPLSYDNITHCPVIYDSNNLTIFIRVDVNPDDVSRVFGQRYEAYSKLNKGVPEVCSITWLNIKEFRYCVDSYGYMYERLRAFLSRANHLLYFL